MVCQNGYQILFKGQQSQIDNPFILSQHILIEFIEFDIKVVSEQVTCELDELVVSVQIGDDCFLITTWLYKLMLVLFN